MHDGTTLRSNLALCSGQNELGDFSNCSQTWHHLLMAQIRVGSKDNEFFKMSAVKQ